MSKFNDDDDDTVVIDGVRAHSKTDKALHCLIGGVWYWIPQSVIHDDSEVFDAGEHAAGKLVLARWFAEKNGLAL